MPLEYKENFLYIRVDKTGSSRPWSRVIMCCSKLSLWSPNALMGELFWQKKSLLQYTLTLSQSAPRTQRSCFAHLNVLTKIHLLFQPWRFQILSRIFKNGLVMQHFREKKCTSHIHCCYLILCYLFCSPNEARWWILWIKFMITF